MNKLLILDCRKELVKACIKFNITADIILSRRKYKSDKFPVSNLINYILVSSTHNFEEVITKIAENFSEPYVNALNENENGTVLIFALKSIFCNSYVDATNIMFRKSKFLQKKALGVNTANIYRIGDEIKNIDNYNFIIKPEFGAGTVDTYNVSSQEEFEMLQSCEESLVYETAIDVKTEFYIDGWIDQNGKVQNSIISKYNRPVLNTVNDYNSIAGYVCKFENNSEKEKIISIVDAVINSHGQHSSTFHAEIFLDANGFYYFSEIGYRYGGAFIPQAYELETGVSMFDISVLLATGNELKIKELFLAQQGVQHKHIGWSAIRTSKSGVIKHLPSEKDFLNSIVGLQKVSIEVCIGGNVPEPSKNSYNRCGLILCSHNDHQQLLLSLKKSQQWFENQIEVATQL